MVVRFGVLSLFLACSARQSARPTAAPRDPVVAEVHGERIRASEVDGMLALELTKLDHDYTQKRHDMRRHGLDAILFRKLVEHEAAKHHIDGEEYLRREVESKLVQPDEPELRGFFLENADKLAPLTYEEVRPKLIQFLMTQRRSEMILGLYARLKREAQPTILLPQEVAPVARNTPVNAL